MTSSEVKISQPFKGNWIENLACSILKCGPMPKHVAFIMDGNRRYAEKAKIARADGHKKGYDTLARVLGWCRELGISQITLYAFSVENFKRSSDEVNSIMDLARNKCDSLLDELDNINEAGIKVKVAGDLHLLPQDLKHRVEKIHKLTNNNDKAYLNICMAYTSRLEMVAAIKKLSHVVHNDKTINPEDIDLTTLERNLYLPRPFPDLIIRTSGEIRLSDFMLWQCQESMLVFVDSLWPEISLWELTKAVFHFQCQKKLGTNISNNAN